MRNNTTRLRENDGAGQFPVVWITALIGVVTSLFIGVLTYLLNLFLETPYPLFLGALAGLLAVDEFQPD